MATGLSLTRERVHVLDVDKDEPKEKQTRWFFRPLEYSVNVRVKDGLIEFKGAGRGDDNQTRTSILSGTQEREILVNGLVRVENYFDEDGVELHWPEGRGQTVFEQRMRFISTMRDAWRRELAEAINEATSPTAKDESELRFRGPSERGVEPERVLSAD